MNRIVLSILLIASLTNLFGQSSAKILTPHQMQEDLKILNAAWTHLHPGLYRYNTPRQIQSYFKVLDKQCSKPLSETKFYLLLSQLAQKIKCGHTYLNPLNLDSATQARILPNRVIPFLFEVVKGKKIVITHNLTNDYTIKRGDEITSINNISVKQIIDSLLTVSRSDGMNSLGKKINNINETPDEMESYSIFDIYFPLFFPVNDTKFQFKIKAYGDKKLQVKTFNLLSYGDRAKKYQEYFGIVPSGDRSWEYKFLNTNTAYMKFGTFAFWNGEFNPTNYVDSIFADVLKHQEIKNLVIDIRNNEGGDNTGEYILSYITSSKIGCDDPDRPCYRFLSIPDSLLPYLSTWDSTFKKPKDSTKYFKNNIGLYELKPSASPCEFIIPKAIRFMGTVYLITNAKNSSAGYEMARNFRTAKIGLIVGQTTGGSQQGINGGEFFFLDLPNSKFEIDLPLIYSYHDNKPDRGISPDFTVENSQHGIANLKDVQLEFILNKIKSKQ